MREIKFRAWDGEEMIYDFSKEKNLCQIVVGFNDANNLEIAWEGCGEEAMIIMQYTGLKDKNGKEIYEGDILRLHEYGGVDTPVVFHNGAFCLKGFNWQHKTAEVVGNIYETPELIQSKQAQP